MRTIVVVAILLLGISSARPEPEHAAMARDSLQSGPSIAVKPVISVPPVQTMEPSPPSASAQPASSGQAAPPNAGPAPIPTPALAHRTPARSLDEVCNTLFMSAQDNDLPVTFFANLIWQESRLRNSAVSPKGAMGIAQFMPKVAAKSGLENPFDPAQALPASAKLLHDLFDQLGNLGYVAAAYNAGMQRVLDWLERGRSLPRETRGYVMNITGRSVEAWRKTPEDEASLRLAQRLPCRGLPAFAALEQAQAKQAGPERKQAEQARAQVTPPVQVTQQVNRSPQVTRSQQVKQQVTPSQQVKQQVTPSHQANRPVQATASQQKMATRQKRGRPQQLAKAPTATLRAKLVHVAKDERSHKPIRREVVVRIAKRERPHIRHEAKERVHHALRERHLRV